MVEPMKEVSIEIISTVEENFVGMMEWYMMVIGIMDIELDGETTNLEKIIVGLLELGNRI